MPLQLTQLDPERYAAAQRALFAGRRLRVGTGQAVHAVAWVPWVEGYTLPMPACRTGWAGYGVSGDMLPTGDAVTCRRCLALYPAETGQVITAGQLTLW